MVAAIFPISVGGSFFSLNDVPDYLRGKAFRGLVIQLLTSIFNKAENEEGLRTFLSVFEGQEITLWDDFRDTYFGQLRVLSSLDDHEDAQVEEVAQGLKEVTHPLHYPTKGVFGLNLLLQAEDRKIDILREVTYDKDLQRNPPPENVELRVGEEFILPNALEWKASHLALARVDAKSTPRYRKKSIVYKEHFKKVEDMRDSVFSSVEQRHDRDITELTRLIHEAYPDVRMLGNLVEKVERLKGAKPSLVATGFVAVMAKGDPRVGRYDSFVERAITELDNIYYIPLQVVDDKMAIDNWRDGTMFVEVCKKLYDRNKPDGEHPIHHIRKAIVASAGLRVVQEFQKNLVMDEFKIYAKEILCKNATLKANLKKVKLSANVCDETYDFIATLKKVVWVMIGEGPANLIFERRPDGNMGLADIVLVGFGASAFRVAQKIYHMYGLSDMTEQIAAHLGGKQVITKLKNEFDEFKSLGSSATLPDATIKRINKLLVELQETVDSQQTAFMDKVMQEGLARKAAALEACNVSEPTSLLQIGFDV